MTQMIRSSRNGPTNDEIHASTIRLASRTYDKLQEVESRFNARLNALEQRAHAKEGESPWLSFGDFLAAVRRSSGASVDSRLIEHRSASGLNGTGAPDEGGYLLPEDYSAALTEMVMYSAPLASRCMSITAAMRSIDLPAIDETSRANGSRWGGVVSGWLNEGDSLPTGKPKFRKLQLHLKKLAAAVYVTNELQEDSGALGTFVSKAFTAEAAYVLDDMIMNGDGAGQPLGILNAPGLITVAKQAGQTAGTIVAANITDMFGRILPECLPNAVWLMSPELFAALYGMYTVAGTGAVSTPMITPADAGAPFGRLLSRPVLPVEPAKAIGSVGDIVLVDLSKHVLYEKPIDQAVSMHVRFVNGEDVYRFTYRVDGAPIVKSPITPKNGGPTKSSMVALAAR